MIGIYKKILFRFNRYLFWKKVRKNDYFTHAFYSSWRENNKFLNKRFKEQVLNDFKK